MIFFGIANEWERHGVFCLGKLSRFVGPGLYFYLPFLERPLFRVDKRIITYIIPLQRGMTRDNIPVDVDAVVFYKVEDEKSAILLVEHYHAATQLSARTAVRDMVGRSSLDELLAERATIGPRLRDHIGSFTSRWGVTVIAVEIKDVIVSKELEDAIAREPAAEREKRARVKLAEAEVLAAGAIAEAARSYEGKPIALALRSMNMLYEMCMEGKSTMVFVPTERTGAGMPGVIGLQSIENLLEKTREAGAPGNQG